MDPMTIVGVIFSAGIGLTALHFQRRQTLLAEAVNQQTRTTQTVDVLNRVLSTKTIRVGLVHYPPFVTALGDDEPPSGLYVDLLREFCLALDIEIHFEQVRFSSAVHAVQNDEVDLVLSIFQTPRRSRTVDFCAFMHTVSVTGVVRRAEDRISSQADLLEFPLRFVVCRGEIGHELLEDVLRVPRTRMMVIDTSNVADIIEMVAAKKADLAIADSLSCYHGLAARGAEGPKLKPVLRRRPIYSCMNGIMIARSQDPLADWLERGLRPLLVREDFRKAERSILEEFHPFISKI